MVNNFKTLDNAPELPAGMFPLYLRCLHRRWYIKIVSDQKCAWLYVISTPGYSSMETGKRTLDEDTYFDVLTLTTYFEKSDQLEYESKLLDILDYYELVGIRSGLIGSLPFPPKPPSPPPESAPAE